jgi:hypothetical protein
MLAQGVAREAKQLAMSRNLRASAQVDVESASHSRFSSGARLRRPSKVAAVASSRASRILVSRTCQGSLRRWSDRWVAFLKMASSV